MTPIPVEVRRRIIALYDKGKTTDAIANALGYCVAAVRRVRQHARERGTLVPATDKCGRKGRFTPEVRAVLARLRTAAARTVDDLHAAIGRAFEQVTLDDLLGCFADCGYKTAT